MRSMVLVACLLVGCHHQPPAMKLSRVILYQNGIGYFERTGHLGSDRLVLSFSRHEVDDVLKTLTVLDKLGAGVATVDVPAIGDKDRSVPIGVQLSSGHVHDVLVSYAIPTPSWQAAYRIVLDDTGGLLQGWAVIDNASQEDWRDIHLTLATGAPMSYALDLHTPKYVDRPDVTGHMVAPVVLGVVGGEKAGAAAGDKDGDGIPNAEDACPDQPEDKDGFEDADGCPDLDNDKDRIPDKKDQCPNEPETYNGFQDEDGCPDRGRVVVTDTSIEILDMVYFDKNTATIKQQSLPIVDAIAGTLNGNPTIKLVEIQGHAAEDESNHLALSDTRAAHIRAALLSRGVSAERLTPQGYGNTQPMDRGHTEKAHAKNRRVAFLILKRSDGDEDRPRQQVIDTHTVAASAPTHTKPVEVAGAVRYELATPVTVRHGSSTMVSILNKPVTAEDVYLFRPDANAPGSDQHPFRAVRLVNSSGFTLQPGPIAIFARGTFVGDSLMDHLAVDETAWFPYAIDSSTTVTVETKADERPIRIVSIHKGVLAIENAGLRTTRYMVAAGRETERKIYLRHAKAAGYTPTELPPGTIDQGQTLLVPLPLSPARVSDLVIEEHEPRRRSVRILDAGDLDLGVYVDASNLAPDLAAKLKAAIALRKDLATLETELSTARSKFGDMAQRSAELRENLKALDKVKNAEDLKKKLVTGIRQAATDSDALTKTITEKTEAIATARSRLEDAIRDLQVDEKK